MSTSVLAQSMGFSKRESCVLSGLSHDRITYLDRSGLVTPTRVNLPGYARPVLQYSWAQILELRAIAHLRTDISLQTVRKVVDFIESHSNDSRLSTKRILVINDEVFWVNPDFSDIPNLMIEMVKNPGQTSNTGFYMLLPDLQSEIMESAKKSEIIDFNQFKARIGLKSA